ncbi:MAG: hypothetical protein A3E23_07080 [Burkholderiales bacterium RIFCSPHIGHO2_12_FULL_65_48]|nr:MAG: hypothetical protein A3C40_19650 [Burkholderiales bacterium RIFCSPHIGHO2_02_FULL_64_19]OGB10767.1 MAG: hypothetical protein A3E23_07080 [Burkholderiales bacterium RIFCSPHIGHO2_12_FULL_65_48]OGB52493.1 MAG: hypothetical protein A3F71_07740 [Burkholderiales bacterium RIFCSPLOWO2_12_FULL_64_33]
MGCIVKEVSASDAPHGHQRPATPEEQAAIGKLFSSAPTAATRLKQGIENAFVLWATSLLALVVVWLLLGWLASKVWDVHLGLRSTATLWVMALATPACAVLAVRSSVKWVRTLPDYRPLLRQDLADSLVNEERYVFTEARRFQEPEHGGLMYFLRTNEDEVFTVYDYESQTLGIDDQDPLQSAYRPQTQLVVIRAPNSGLVLCSQGSGAPLEVGAPVDLAVGPEKWPKPETLCDIPWSQLNVRLASSTVVSAKRNDG